MDAAGHDQVWPCRQRNEDGRPRCAAGALRLPRLQFRTALYYRKDGHRYLGASINRSVGAAARLPDSDREELAIQARSEPVSDLTARHGVSRKFVFAQPHKARIALDDAFLSAAAEDEVLFELKVTKAWLCRVVALALDLPDEASPRARRRGLRAVSR